MRLRDPLPFDTVEAADGLVGELVERGGGEVEIPAGTTDAAVDSGDLNRLALV